MKNFWFFSHKKETTSALTNIDTHQARRQLNWIAGLGGGGQMNICQNSPI